MPHDSNGNLQCEREAEQRVLTLRVKRAIHGSE